jgi:hypothetical protein
VRRLGGLVCVVGAALFVTAIAVWSSGPHNPPESASDAQSGPRPAGGRGLSPPPTTGSASRVGAAVPLQDLVVGNAPAGYAQLQADAGPNGTFDLNAFVRWSNHPDEDRAALASNGFLRGFVRSWKRPASAGGAAQIVASVFEFQTESGAQGMRAYENARTVKDDGGNAFPVPGASGLHFVHNAGGAPVYGYTVTFRQQGTRLFYLTALYLTDQSPDEVLAMAQRQLDLLKRLG